MPASAPRVRKSTAAAVAAVAGLAIVGTFAIDSSGAANAATTSTAATVADVRTAGTTTQSDALVQFQRMTAAVAKDVPAKPVAVTNGAQITDSRVLAAKAAEKAAAEKKAAEAKAAAKADADRRAAEARKAADQLASFDQIISHESGWNVTATNPSSGSYGLGQALPAEKMASQGADWRTDPVTQIKWALNYMDSRYGSPNSAWQFWQANNWY